MEDEHKTVVINKDNSKGVKWVIFATVIVALLGLAAFSLNLNSAVENDTAMNTIENVDNQALMESEDPDDANMALENDAMAEVAGTVNEDDDVAGEESMVEAKTIKVEGGSFYFNPDVIEVKKGEKVKITFNAVDMMHDFVVDELNVRTPVIKSGETAEVEFTATKTGEYQFYCSVGNHAAQGMVGTLIVTE